MCFLDSRERGFGSPDLLGSRLLIARYHSQDSTRSDLLNRADRTFSGILGLFLGRKAAPCLHHFAAGVTDFVPPRHENRSGKSLKTTLMRVKRLRYVL